MIRILMYDILDVNNILIVRKLELTPILALRFIKGKFLYNELLNRYILKHNFINIFSYMYQNMKHTKF